MTRPPYPVIDAHTHIMPWDQIRPDASATMSNRPDFADILAISSDPDRLIRYMHACGVSHTVLINYLSPDVVGFTEETNDYSVKIGERLPG